MRNKIVVVGSANIDMVVKSERFPEPGETILGGDFYMLPGGKGANQAVTAARLGGDVHFMCRVGDDDFGRRSIEGYEKEAIDTSHIIVDAKAPTGVALISVNGDAENKIVVAQGANNGFTEQEIQGANELLVNAKIIVLQLEIPLETVGQIIQIANQNDTRVILNPAPAQPLPEWYYDDLFLITPNETEAEQLTGIKIEDKNAVLKSAEWFQDRGVHNVIITMGSRGAYVCSSSFNGFISAPSVNSQDTTAAGDIFNGALAVALTENKPWKQATGFASRAAALSVSKIGAQRSSPKREELQSFSERLQRL